MTERRLDRMVVARWISGATILMWALIPFGLALSQAPKPHASATLRFTVWGINILLLSLLAVGAFLGRRCAPGVGWIYAAMLVGCFALLLVAPNSPGIVLAYFAVGVATARVSVRWGMNLMLASVVTILVMDLVQRKFDFWMLASFVGVFFVAMTSREREALRASEARNAVLAERAHIAREIHDILAHSLSAQIVHLEGARLMLERDTDRDQIKDRVERAQRLARAGLEETRRALAALRGDAPAPEEALAALAEEFSSVTGRPADVEITGSSRDLPPQAAVAVVRTAQEALTNVRKHAPEARVAVRLRYLADMVELEVKDTGGSAPLAVEGVEGAGYGLVGMRERAELIGGTLEAGPAESGFRVFLRVPAGAETTAE